MGEEVRVYVPATFGALADLARSGVLRAEHAMAVTDALRGALPGLDEEELELEALLDAAHASAALLLVEPATPRRRVVVAADVPRAWVTSLPQEGPAVVRLGAAVPAQAVASIHVDEARSEARVAAGEAADLDLLWYAPQEIGDLLRD